MRCFVVMGVAGCGKTSVGEGLAAQTGLTFIDGDSLHPQANIAKMSAGVPLTDEDRAPWLAEVGRVLAATDGPVAIGCSALKQSYRQIIRDTAGEAVGFLHLHADRSVIAARMAERAGHFMPLSLLDSQFATLEPLGPKETGCIIDIDQSLGAVIAAAADYIKEVSP